MASYLDFTLEESKVHEGVRLPLYDRNNKITDQWIMVRSRYSEAVEKAAESWKTKIRQNPDLAEDENEELRVRVAMVSDWSFDQECNAENIGDFLRKAPHIAEKIDRCSNNHRLFMFGQSDSSLNGAGGKSNSSEARTESEQHASI